MMCDVKDEREYDKERRDGLTGSRGFQRRHKLKTQYDNFILSAQKKKKLPNDNMNKESERHLQGTSREGPVKTSSKVSWKRGSYADP